MPKTYVTRDEQTLYIAQGPVFQGCLHYYDTWAERLLRSDACYTKLDERVYCVSQASLRALPTTLPYPHKLMRRQLKQKIVEDLSVAMVRAIQKDDEKSASELLGRGGDPDMDFWFRDGVLTYRPSDRIDTIYQTVEDLPHDQEAQILISHSSPLMLAVHREKWALVQEMVRSFQADWGKRGHTTMFMRRLISPTTYQDSFRACQSYALTPHGQKMRLFCTEHPTIIDPVQTM